MTPKFRAAHRQPITDDMLACTTAAASCCLPNPKLVLLLYRRDYGLPTHAMIQQSLDDLDLRPPSRGRGVEPPPDYMVFGISIGLAFSWLLVSWLATTASGQRSEVCQSFSLPATCLMDFRQPDNPPAPTASDNTGTTTAEADQPAQVFCSTILCDTSQF